MADVAYLGMDIHARGTVMGRMNEQGEFLGNQSFTTSEKNIIATLKAVKEPIKYLLKLYVKFHKEAEKDDSLNEEARIEFKKLEDNDKENTAPVGGRCAGCRRVQPEPDSRPGVGQALAARRQGRWNRRRDRATRAAQHGSNGAGPG